MDDFLHENILISAFGTIYEYQKNNEDEYYAQEITRLDSNSMSVGGNGSKIFWKSEMNNFFIITSLTDKELTLNRSVNKVRFILEKLNNLV